jgi:Kdo2-lipid IVA lauroyltransferase/acyltransferase
VEVEDMSAEASIDVREGGRWTLAQRAKNDVLFVAIEAALAIATRVPEGMLRHAGRALGALAHAVIPAAKRIARANVRRAFPELSACEVNALVRRNYRRLGERLAEAVASLDERRELEPLPFAPGALETLQGALAEGRGMVFASAHLGPWERVAATLVSAGLPLTAVAREAYDPRLTPIYDRLRGGRGVRVIYRSEPRAAAKLLRTLRSGGMLGIPMDLASRVPSVDVPFLGVPAKTPVGPAKLAVRTGAVVVVGAIGRGGMITTTRIDGSPDSVELTARINEELSRRIREIPEEWVWMHRRFVS